MLKAIKEIGCKYANIISFVLLFVPMIPTLIALCYVVPGGDDFSIAVEIESKKEYSNAFFVAAEFVKEFYFTHQGTFFGSFIGILFLFKSILFKGLSDIITISQC